MQTPYAEARNRDATSDSEVTILAVLFRWRWAVLSAAVVGGLVGGLYSAVATPKYRAETTLSYVDDRGAIDGLTDIASQFGDLAALAGIGVGESGSGRAEALGILQSRDLTSRFIEQQALLTKLFASQWDAETNTWLHTWRRDRPPTISDATKLFERDIRSVLVSPRTGLVTLSITWTDPVEAATWANALVKEANSRLRERAVSESQSRIDYLRQEIEGSQLLELQQTLVRLVETEIKAISIARAREDFAFRVVDSARPPDPDDYESPRLVANVLTTSVGFCLVMSLIAIAVTRLRR